MEWSTLQHLDLRHIWRGVRPLQPHAASFHPHQAFVAVAIGTYIVEFDALTGSKISALDIGAPAVWMSYSPTSGHTVIAILQDYTIRFCDFDLEQTCVLHSPKKKTEQISSDAEVHMALTPLQPVVFLGSLRERVWQLLELLKAVGHLPKSSQSFKQHCKWFPEFCTRSSERSGIV